eukprot:1145582-Pelagomonas_calceolata.AAC.7
MAAKTEELRGVLQKRPCSPGKLGLGVFAPYKCLAQPLKSHAPKFELTLVSNLKRLAVVLTCTHSTAANESHECNALCSSREQGHHTCYKIHPATALHSHPCPQIRIDQREAATLMLCWIVCAGPQLLGGGSSGGGQIFWKPTHWHCLTHSTFKPGASASFSTFHQLLWCRKCCLVLKLLRVAQASGDRLDYGKAGNL